MDHRTLHPADPAPTPNDPPADAAPAFHPPATLDDSRHADGWTADRQRQFLVAIAQGACVTRATALVGMSRQSAYALRDSARGAAFALGWRAAVLRSRDVLADTLMDRAFHGVRETITYGDGAMTTRHRHDNALAYRMLVRLDRRADAALAAGSPRAAQRPSGAGAGEDAAARLAAADFEQYLELVQHHAAPGRAALFVAARIGAAGVDAPDGLDGVRALARADRWLRTRTDAAAPVPVDDLDPAARAGWTAEQWGRAEAAGLIALAPEPPAPETGSICPNCQPDDLLDALTPRDPVWWCEESEDWRTRFPPPPDFFGDQDGLPGEPDYERELTDAEREAIEDNDAARLAPAIRTGAVDRDAWFAALATETAIARAGPAPMIANPADAGADGRLPGDDAG
ncbi:hypothetical protein ACNI3Q_10235 [Sphingomonas sp. FW199]|uniref:hypothetical protein n=1 Tax=Sphingomonas sp. FW199 TaxID=3400217 RepID=UPI003CF5820B